MYDVFYRYQLLDQQKAKITQAKLANPKQSFEASLQARVGSFGGEDKLSWIYGNDIEEVWRTFLRKENVDFEQ
jgi:salicylate hydroxylase